nr:sec-independent protein translocase protein TATB, chloroplastic [Tanacetum cinerariifolium]
MSSTIINPKYTYHPASPLIIRKPPIYASQISCSKTLKIQSLKWVSSWNGLRNNGFSVSLKSLNFEKRKKCTGKGVYASLFGVGAPEALVIGVVALLVFGPKGLAEVAKNLGKTLRAFQPTIRELQEVSREFKSTLEKEIGLDEIQNPVQGSYTSNTVRPPPSQASPDTLQNSQLKETATTSGVGPVDSQETTTTPTVSEEDSKPTDDTTNGSTSSKLYTSEELLKVTAEQLKAVTSQQQTEQPSSLTPSEKPENEM